MECPAARRPRGRTAECILLHRNRRSGYSECTPPETRIPTRSRADAPSPGSCVHQAARRAPFGGSRTRRAHRRAPRRHPPRRLHAATTNGAVVFSRCRIGWTRSRPGPSGRRGPYTDGLGIADAGALAETAADAGPGVDKRLLPHARLQRDAFQRACLYTCSTRRAVKGVAEVGVHLGCAHLDLGENGGGVLANTLERTRRTRRRALQFVSGQPVAEHARLLPRKDHRRAALPRAWAHGKVAAGVFRKRNDGSVGARVRATPAANARRQKLVLRQCAGRAQARRGLNWPPAQETAARRRAGNAHRPRRETRQESSTMYRPPRHGGNSLSTLHNALDARGDLLEIRLARYRIPRAVADRIHEPAVLARIGTIGHRQIPWTE
jgi:hypothetical protein